MLSIRQDVRSTAGYAVPVHCAEQPTPLLDTCSERSTLPHGKLVATYSAVRLSTPDPPTNIVVVTRFCTLTSTSPSYLTGITRPAIPPYIDFQILSPLHLMQLLDRPRIDDICDFYPLSGT